MKRILKILLILCISLSACIYLYTKHHDSAGMDTTLRMDVMAPVTLAVYDAKAAVLTFNDQTFWHYRFDPAVTLTIDGQTYHLEPYRFASIEPDYRQSSLSSPSSMQFDHSMEIILPSPILNTAINAQEVTLTIKYTNGLQRSLSLKEQIASYKYRIEGK